MDERLAITEAPRGGHEALGDVPLTTVGWRYLNKRGQTEVRAREEARREKEKLLKGLCAAARHAVQVRRLVRRLASSDGKDEAVCKALAAATETLSTALGEAGLLTLVPEGEPLTGDLTEVFESVAQQPDPLLTRPYVLEVIEPAVLYGGALLAMGRAVVVVPAASSPGGAD